jgi:hypothetical protein
MGVWCSYESPNGTDTIVPRGSSLVDIAPEIKWDDLEPVDIRAALEELPKSDIDTEAKRIYRAARELVTGSGCCNCGHAGVFHLDEPCKSCDLAIKEGKGPTNWIPGRD